MMRERLRCAVCGRRGARLHHPNWVDAVTGFQAFPADLPVAYPAQEPRNVAASEIAAHLKEARRGFNAVVYVPVAIAFFDLEGEGHMRKGGSAAPPRT